MTEQYFQVFDLTDPKSAERKALFEQVQGFCQTKSSRVSPDFYKRLKLLHFTGELQLQPEARDGMTPSYAPMCLCMCSPVVDEEVFRGYFRDYGSSHSYGAVIELIVTHVRLGALVEYPLLLERWQLMAKIVLVGETLLVGCMADLLSAVFGQLVRRGTSVFSLTPGMFNEIERAFNNTSFDPSTNAMAENAIDRLRTLWSGDATILSAYEDEWFVQFSKRFFAKELAADFQVLCDSVYQSIPSDQRVTFDGKRLLLPAA